MYTTSTINAEQHHHIPWYVLPDSLEYFLDPKFELLALGSLFCELEQFFEHFGVCHWLGNDAAKLSWITPRCFWCLFRICCSLFGLLLLFLALDHG